MLHVSETFGPTLQGEGLRVGERTWFVRLAGCDSRCSWCDTKYALGEGSEMPEEEIADRLDLSLCRNVVLTGGNPVAQDATRLVGILKSRGARVCVETQGTLFHPWLGLVDTIAVSPKREGVQVDVLKQILDLRRRGVEVFFKPVVFAGNAEDLRFAKRLVGCFPGVPFVIQLGTTNGSVSLRDLKWLAEEVAGWKTQRDIRVLPQLHVLIWGARRGV